MLCKLAIYPSLCLYSAVDMYNASMYVTWVMEKVPCPKRSRLKSIHLGREVSAGRTGRREDRKRQSEPCAVTWHTIATGVESIQPWRSRHISSHQSRRHIPSTPPISTKKNSRCSRMHCILQTVQPKYMAAMPPQWRRNRSYPITVLQYWFMHDATHPAKNQIQKVNVIISVKYVGFSWRALKTKTDFQNGGWKWVYS